MVSPGNSHGCRSGRLLRTSIGRKAGERRAPAALAAWLHPFHLEYHAGRLPSGERIAVRLGAGSGLAPSRRSGPGGGTRAREKTAQLSAENRGQTPVFPRCLRTGPLTLTEKWGLSPVSLCPRFRGGETAAFEKSLQDGEPPEAVGQLEELLLGDEGHREDFSQAVAYPRGVVEGVRFGENGRALVENDHFQKPRAGRKLFGNRDACVGSDELDVGRDQTLGTGLTLEDAKAPVAASLEIQNTLLLHVAFEDLRKTADRFRHGGRADLGPLLDEAHPERFIAFEAFARHVHVTRFEHTQRKQASRKEHRVERENRDAQRFQERVQPSALRPSGASNRA